MTTTTLNQHHDIQTTTLSILCMLSICHCLNDMIQSLLPALYPLIKNSLSLNYTQIGLITFVFQITASILQPFVGFYIDKRPKPYSLVIGMGCSLCGLLLLSVAPVYGMVLLAAAMVGMGSSIFHPESSRMARLASGGRHGFAQSLFQLGGNVGSSTGPLIAAFIVIPNGQHSIAWFALVALLAMGLLFHIGRWYQASHMHPSRKQKPHADVHFSKQKIIFSLAILLLLAFSKFFYMSSIGNYYTFYLMEKFHLSIQDAQLRLFIFLAASAAGTFLGGPLGDRIGRRYIIWFSILGVLPFTLMMPYANLLWTSILSILTGLILASAFSAMVVYAQELMPGRIGMVSGLFFGFAFGVAGLAAALLGVLVDHTSLEFVYHICSFLPAIGVLAIFLPNTHPKKVQSPA